MNWNMRMLFELLSIEVSTEPELALVKASIYRVIRMEHALLLKQRGSYVYDPALTPLMTFQ